jgi:hypothetical protein
MYADTLNKSVDDLNSWEDNKDMHYSLYCIPKHDNPAYKRVEGRSAREEWGVWANVRDNMQREEWV